MSETFREKYKQIPKRAKKVLFTLEKKADMRFQREKRKKPHEQRKAWKQE